MAKIKRAGDKILDVDWSAASNEPVQLANVFAAQANAEYHVLNIGFAAPPVIATEGDRQRAHAMEHIPARIVARVVLSPGDIRQLVKVLSGNIASRERLLAQLAEEGQEQ